MVSSRRGLGRPRSSVCVGLERSAPPRATETMMLGLSSTGLRSQMISLLTLLLGTRIRLRRLGSKRWKWQAKRFEALSMSGVENPGISL
jgi:hypothetical protein